MHRRNFLKVVGSSSVILAASTSMIGCSTISGPSADQPWHIAGSNYKDFRMRALSWAILAPNPHNRQPWLVKMIGADSLVLSLDTERMLPETDPYNRQIMIGMGCFSELLRLAAAEDGYHLVIDWFPDGVVSETGTLDNRAIASIQFVKGAEPDGLFKQVSKRRSFKKEFLDKIIDSNILNKIEDAQIEGALINLNNESIFVEKMRKLTIKAMDVELSTERTYLESINLLRIGSDEVKANPDGISLNGYSFTILRMLGLFTHEDARDMNSSGYKQSAEDLLSVLDSAYGYVWITTPGNNRLDQIKAGQNYLRVNLKVTELGLKIHPISQSLQEYDEMGGSMENVNKLTGVNAPERLQMLARLGYGEDISASPRWPVDKMIRS
ncbi:MAG: twin-arginine translocation pathway signal protein [Kangiella sp.]|nr:MAG: twin-arginine translocation pathway signal protein [Kangiella sp.]